VFHFHLKYYQKPKERFNAFKAIITPKKYFQNFFLQVVYKDLITSKISVKQLTNAAINEYFRGSNY
tara:strand:- start:93439 stop:93636 length:198 start_codon:yes stop_codon:yes gene_type:complete